MAIIEGPAVEEPSVEEPDWYCRLGMPPKGNGFILSPEPSSSEQPECSESFDEADEPSEPKSEQKSIGQSQEESKEGDYTLNDEERQLKALEIEVENAFTKK